MPIVHKKLPEALAKCSPLKKKKSITNLIILATKQLHFNHSTVGWRIVFPIKYIWTSWPGRYFLHFQNILPKGMEENGRNKRSILQKLHLDLCSKKITQHFTKDELNWHPAILIHFCISLTLSVHIDWNIVLCVLYKWLRINDPAVQ